MMDFLDLFDADFWKFSCAFIFVLVVALFTMNYVADRYQMSKDLQIATPSAR